MTESTSWPAVGQRPGLRSGAGCVLLVVVLLAGCVTQRVDSADAPSGSGNWADAPVTTEVVRMDSSPNAVQSFDPLVSRITEGGECTVTELPADGVRSLSIAYPTLNDPRTRVTIVVDAAGTVLRYVEERGGQGPRTEGGAPDVPGASDGPPRTTIEMNFQTGQARAINTGGGRVGFGVQGRTMDFQYHEALGQPLQLAEQVRQRCSE